MAASDAAGDDLFDWLTAEHPAIVAEGNEAAFDYYNRLIQAEIDGEEAIDLTYTKFPALKPKEPEPVEPAVARMGLGGTRPSEIEGEEEDYFEKIRRLKAEAKD
mgnify:FL=1